MALCSLYVRDFAIVRRLELTLEPGLSVLTGETGAGKSILIDALALTLGARGETAGIRQDADSAEVIAGFSLADNPQAGAWLRDQDLWEDDQCILRRIIYREKPSRGFINGRPVTVQSLRDLGELLVDIHGQHEHQTLMQRDMQRQVLDDYAALGDRTGPLAALYQQYQQLQARWQAVTESSSDRTARLELLRYQVDELQKLDVKPDEYRELDTEHRRLAHASELISGIQSVTQTLYDADEESLNQTLTECARKLEGLTDFEHGLSPIVSLLNEALVLTDEAAGQLHHLLDGLELDPERLTWIEDRIGVILNFSRKHHCDAGQLPDTLNRLESELRDIEDADVTLDALRAEIDATRGQYHDLAKQVSAERKRAAARLSRKVTEQMQDLGMKGGRLEVGVSVSADPKITRYGHDRVEFLVSTNPGQPVKPMTKVASGGELSRISLAIQAVTAAVGRIPSLIFDEVDVGVGGAVAEIVGHKLRSLGASRQVLCVTHLPQVAVQGHQHLVVEKEQDGGVYVDIRPLDPGAREIEIARMLGGLEMTDQTLAHARDMLTRAAS